MNPPRIHHLHGLAADDRPSLCLLCSKALHMGKGEAALLKYYAACSDGFSPAVKTVCGTTGITKKQVYNNRDALINHGVIALSKGSLFIDWKRIRTFASLDPRMTSKHCTIAPVDTKKLHYNIYIDSRLYIRLKTCSQEYAIKFMGSLSDRQYERLCEYIRNKRE